MLTHCRTRQRAKRPDNAGDLLVLPSGSGGVSSWLPKIRPASIGRIDAVQARRSDLIDDPELVKLGVKDIPRTVYDVRVDRPFFKAGRASAEYRLS